MSNFYISDLHFGHENIIHFDNRPFLNIEEMDNALIKNWNDVVSSEDTVYILGDISWYRSEKTVTLLTSLNGTKVLIKGNHDKISPQIRSCFKTVHDYLEVKDVANGKTERVILSHFPILFWNGQFHNSIHLYGHVHNSHQWNICESFKKSTRELQDLPMRMYNVGVMVPYMNYTPKTLESILASE